MARSSTLAPSEYRPTASHALATIVAQPRHPTDGFPFTACRLEGPAPAPAAADAGLKCSAVSRTRCKAEYGSSVARNASASTCTASCAAT